jgi:hypothetical protein
MLDIIVRNMTPARQAPKKPMTGSLFNGEQLLDLKIKGRAIIKDATMEGIIMAPTTSSSPSKYFNS